MEASDFLRTFRIQDGNDNGKFYKKLNKLI